MEIQSLSKHELLQDNTLRQLYQETNGDENELYFEFKERTQKEKITNLFNKKYKELKKKMVRGKIEKINFCEFDDERFEEICTGSWIANTQGIFKQVPNYETGEVEKIEASRMMLVPKEILLNVDTGEEKTKILFNKYGQWKELVCEKKTISIAHKIVELSSKGLDVTSTNSKNIVDYFYDCLTLNNTDIIPCFKSLSRMGWYNEQFMPFSSELKFDGEQQNKYMFNALKSKGNRDLWIAYTSALRENSMFLRMQMAVSFASPLIEKLNLLPFILHIWGKTGTGKTVGTIIAMSIWGNPVMGQLTKSMNNTVNSVMDTCAFMRNIPVALDELQAIKDKMGYDKFVMMICEGVERGRMKYDEAKETRTWKNSFLFTGEEPITNENAGGGVFNRVIEVDVTGKTVIDPSMGEEIVEFYSNNHGLVAKEYIERINEDLEEIKECYKILSKTINNSNDTTTKQAMAMTLIMLGDLLAGKYFFKNEEPLKLEDMKEFLFSEKEVDVTERAYSFITDTISINRNKFESYSNEIWGRISETQIFFQKQKLTEILRNAGYDLKAVQKTWESQGYISKDSQGRYYHSTRCHGIKSSYVVFNKQFDDLE